jgi:hypothetical protein
MGLRTPVCASMVAQCAPTRLSHCDPGPGVGYRIAFYGDDSWSQVETRSPAVTADLARQWIAEANRLAGMIGRLSA